jgi:SNW domain-containing protein 1
MASILNALPAPAREYSKPAPEPQPHGALAMRGVKEPPPYGRRAGFVPRRLEDFGEGAQCRISSGHFACNSSACGCP